MYGTERDRDNTMSRTGSSGMASVRFNAKISMSRFSLSEVECRSKYSTQFSAVDRRGENRQSTWGFSVGTRSTPTRCNFCKSCL